MPLFEWPKIEFKYNSLKHKIEKEVMGTFTQYPLKLAWAITIHKSQGQTFDYVVIVPGRGAFAHGQMYVGLSRCRTLDGIFLSNPIESRDIIYDPRVDRFKNKFMKVKLLDETE